MNTAGKLHKSASLGIVLFAEYFVTSPGHWLPVNIERIIVGQSRGNNFVHVFSKTIIKISKKLQINARHFCIQ